MNLSWTELRLYYKYTLVNSSVFSSIFPIRCLGTPHMEGSDTQLGDLLYIPGRSVWKLCLLWCICYLQCQSLSSMCMLTRMKDLYLNLQKIGLPNTSSSWFNMTMSLEECEGLCLKNCSCTAYSNLDIRGKGSGYLLWFGNLTIWE